MERCGHREAGDIVLGWLVRVVAVLALLGVVAFDGLSIGSARLSLEDQASAAARASSDTWAGAHDVQKCFDSAWASATAADRTNEVEAASFRIDADGVTHLTLRREAPTFVVHLIGPLRHWALARARVSRNGSA